MLLWCSMVVPVVFIIAQVIHESSRHMNFPVPPLVLRAGLQCKYCVLTIFCEVNKQDFLQVFSGIGMIEDNSTIADSLSDTTTIMIPGRPGKLSERLLTCTSHSTASCGAPDHKHWTDRQVSNSSCKIITCESVCKNTTC